MKVGYLVLLSVFSVSICRSADTVWVRLYDGRSQLCPNRAADVVVWDSSIVYTCGGGEFHWPGNSDMLVAAYRADGTFLDANCVGGISLVAKDEVAYSLVLDSAGFVYTAGYTYNDPESRADDITWFKVKIEADTMIDPWANKSFWPGDDRAFDITFGNYGDLYLCGADHRDTLMPDISAFTLIRSNPADGSIIWSKSLMLDKDARPRPRRDPFPGLFYEWGGWDNCATCLSVTREGDIVVGGSGMNEQGERDVWVMEFDTAGTCRWSTVFSSSGHYDDMVFDLAVAEDGSIYACGLSELVEEGTEDLLVFRIADTGGVINEYRYNSVPNLDDFATQLALDDASPQNVYVTGTSESAVRGFQVLTHKLSHELVPLWGSDGAKFGWAADDFGYDIAYSDHRVYVAGTVSDNAWLICYSDSNVVGGETLWTYSYDLPDHLSDYASCLCVVDSDEIYLGGECDRIDSASNWSSMFLARLRTSPGGIEESDSPHRQKLTLRPNPTAGKASLTLGDRLERVSRIDLCDMAGRTLSTLPRRTCRPSGGPLVLDFTGLKPGVYVLRALDETGRLLASTKVVLP